MNALARFHPFRTTGRATAARLAADAQAARVAGGDGACTDRAVAKRFGLAKHEQVGAWFDPESGVAVALGDMLALPRDLARDVLLRALASLEDGEGPSPEISQGDLTIKLGEIAACIARDRADDGLINDHARHRDAFAAAATVAVRAYVAADRRTRGAK